MTTNHECRFTLQVEVNQLRLENYWIKLSEQGLAELSFSSGDVTNDEQFVALFSDPMVLAFLIMDNETGDDIGHLHLTDFEGLSAYAHFGGLRQWHGSKTSVTAARTVLSQLFRLYRSDGNPYVDCLLGLPPVENRFACKFVERVGFKPISIIPSACYIMASNCYADGLLVQLNRSELNYG